MSNNIIQVLELCTSHVIPDTARQLDTVYEVGGYHTMWDTLHVYSKAEVGWTIVVPNLKELTDDDKFWTQVPVELRLILIYAAAKGCRFVMFDADADVEPELPVHEFAL